MWRATATFCAVLLLASCSRLRETSAVDRLKACNLDEGPGDSYCGTLEVWENREARSGRKIALKIVVLPALKQTASPDPLFFLAGGPGQGAAELARDLQRPFRPIQMSRDIVLVDQRGTGESNPLACKPSKESGDRDDATAAALSRLRTCLEGYKSHAEVTRYTTDVAMDDLEDVRRYLGYSKIDLYGASYGTRAAMVYARRYPEHTRAVILDGVAPPDMRLPLYMPRDSQRALDLLIRDCEANAGCRGRFPNLRTRIETLLARLQQHPQNIRVKNPRSGVEEDVEVRRQMVARILFNALYSPVTAATVPLLVEEAEHGDYSGLLALQAAFTDPLASSMAQGMHFSVLCSEDAPRIEPGAVEREAAGTFLGTEFAEFRAQICGFWPHAAMDRAYYADAPSAIPALILSGDLDPVTPPSWGQQVASRWTNSRHLIVPATGHGAWSSGCVLKLMTQFLDEDSVLKLDTSCVERLKRPPFFLGPSGPNPGAAE